MRNPIARIAALFLLLSAWPALSRAAEPQTGTARLSRIDVLGSKRWNIAQILPIIGFKTGESVSKDDLQIAADRLSSSGLFSKVNYRFATIQDGVLLQFELVDAPTYPVSFDNFPWFKNDEIAQAIQKDGVPFDGTAPSTGTVLDGIAQSLQKLMHTRGLNGTVDHQVMQVPGEQREEVQFHVTGSEVKIQSVEFSDPIAKQDKALAERLPDLLGKPYSRATIEMFELEQVRPAYFKQGYLRVQFGEPEPQLVTDQKTPHEPEGTPPNSVKVTIPIEKGSIYKWGGVTWTGNVTVSSNELAALVQRSGLKASDLADGVKLLGLWHAVSDAYGQFGYLDLKLDTVPDYDDSSGQVSYRVSIDEGPQYHMGNLVLSGLSVEGERRVRSAWMLPQGATFNRGYFDDFINGGAKQAFGDLPFHYDKIGSFLDKNAEAATVNVMLDFQ